MPRLPIDWEFNGNKPFLDFGVGTEFLTHLPPTSSFAAAELDKLFAISETEFASLSMSNFSDLSIRSLFGVANNWGVESFRLEGVGNFMTGLIELVKQSPGAQMDQLAQAAVISALDISFGAIGAIPVVGWAINGAWQIARAIYMAIKQASEEEEDIPLRAMGYDGDTDEYQSRRMLNRAETNDWTEIFLPAVRPSSFERISISWGQDKKGKTLGGFLMSPTGTALGGLGVIPGMPLIVSSFQMAKWYKKYKDRPKDYGQLPPGCVYASGTSRAQNLCNSVGDFLPSAKQMGFTLWSMIRKNSATAFKIDHNRILSEWASFFETLIDYTDWLIGNSDYPDNSFQIAYWLQSFTTAASCASGTGKCFPSSLTKNIPGFNHSFLSTLDGSRGVWRKPLTTKGKIAKGWLASHQALVEFFIRDQLKACFQNFLNTLTVAYVGPDFPAITANAKLARKYEENRERLLAHSAVHDVEVDLIPDDYYRARVRQAQKVIGTRILAKASEPRALEGIATDKPPYPQPPPVEKSAKGLALAVAAIAALLLLANRKK
jgi:hypothetical protein